MGMEEALQSLDAWFAAGKREQYSFHVQDALNSETRTEHVACHLIESLVSVSKSASFSSLQSEDQDTPVITFLHGYPGCSYDYRGVLQHLLAEKRLKARLLLVDLLGYGDSDKGVGQARFSVKQHANVLLAVWDRFGITASHLVVHDFSVSVAQELLARQPKGRLAVRVDKIFWLNGSVFIDLNRATPLHQSLSSPAGWLVAWMMSINTLQSSLTSLFSMQHPPSKQVVDDMYKSLLHRGGAKVHHKLVRFWKDRARYKHVWQGALELAMRQDPSRMMFFWGMQDSKSGPHVAAELHRRYDSIGLRISEHADLGHWPHIEDPARVAAAMTDFFTESFNPRIYHRLSGPLKERSNSFRRVSLSHGVLHYSGTPVGSMKRRGSCQRGASPLASPNGDHANGHCEDALNGCSRGGSLASAGASSHAVSPLGVIKETAAAVQDSNSVDAGDVQEPDAVPVLQLDMSVLQGSKAISDEGKSAPAASQEEKMRTAQS